MCDMSSLVRAEIRSYCFTECKVYVLIYSVYMPATAVSGTVLFVNVLNALREFPQIWHKSLLHEELI